MYLIVTRSFPPELGGMQSLMWGLSRELSKIHQENIRGTLDEVDKNLESKNIKGEVILIINGV